MKSIMNLLLVFSFVALGTTVAKADETGQMAPQVNTVTLHVDGMT